MSVLRIQNAVSCGVLKSNSMPRSGASALRNIRPRSRLAGVSAISTWNLATPFAETTSRGSTRSFTAGGAGAAAAANRPASSAKAARRVEVFKDKTKLPVGRRQVGLISATTRPFGPSAKRTITSSPGWRSSSPLRRKVSMCTKISPGWLSRTTKP